MELVKPFCEYNCDYPCSLCLQAHREEQRKIDTKTAGSSTYNPLLDDDNDPPWNGYVGDRATLPITKFTEDGYPLGPTPTTQTQVSYAPPPFREIQRNKIIEPRPIKLFGPDTLVKRRIVI